MKHIHTFENFTNENLNELEVLNEGYRQPNENDADDFIASVLKLGSRSNIFDPFMKKKGIDPIELTVFVKMVADRIKSQW